MTAPATTSAFLDSMLAEFAQFIVASHKKYIEAKRINNDVGSVDGSEKMDICEKVPSNSNFRTYLLYELYKIGVSRKIITGTTTEPKLVLLYVRRNNPIVQPDNLIVKLCRSLYIDMENMLIVSCGDFKCLSLVEFSRLTSGKISHINLKSDGCQIIYNQGLQTTYGADTFEVQNDDESAKTEQIPKEVRDFTIATRTILGADTKFNPTAKTFKDIFTSTCAELDVDLSAISEKYKTNHSLVFNVLTKDTATVKFADIPSTIRLCRSFEHLSIAEASPRWIPVKDFIEDVSAPNSDYEKLYDVITFQIVNGIKELDLIKTIVECNLRNVQIAFSTENKDNIPITDIYESMEHVINMYHTDPTTRKPYYCVAIFLFGENGEKTKIVVPAYDVYYNLKGDKSIDITPENSYNLFSTYWRLIMTNKVADFLAVFDNPVNHPTTADNYCTYAHLFKWFEGLITKFANSVFNSYRQVYIYRNKTIVDVPFAERPIVIEMYNNFKTGKAAGQKVFTSVATAMETILRHDAKFIAWRLSPKHAAEVEQRFVSSKNSQCSQ